MKYLIISSGLRKQGNSWAMASLSCKRFQESGEEAELLALSDHEMPYCDGKTYVDHPTTQLFRDKVGAVQGIILATPVYNFDANSAAKNLIEITGQVWENKVVGFLCAAGGDRSYMSIMGLANSLMLDFRCLIIPRFVYSTGEAFKEGKIVDPEVESRVIELTKEIVRFCLALKGGGHD